MANYNPPPEPGPSPGSLHAAEEILSSWFGAEVVLTSSGRGAMLLWFDVMGLNRYRHQIATPRMISPCVLDVVIRRGFPVDVSTGQQADIVIFYHQYGIPQVACANRGRILEDICHAFFASSETGARAWAGEAAVFSLPKFFGLTTMAGGLIVKDAPMAHELRRRRDSFEFPDEATRQRQSVAFATALGAELETIYLERMINPRLHPSELSGLPEDLQGIRRIGRGREHHVRQLADRLGKWLPPGWRDLLISALPYAFPIFARREQLEHLHGALRDFGMDVDIYEIDVARNCFAPTYETAMLFPCHHAMPQNMVDRIIETEFWAL